MNWYATHNGGAAAFACLACFAVLFPSARPCNKYFLTIYLNNEYILLMQVADIPEGWKKALMVPLISLMFERTDIDPTDAWKQAIDLVRGYAPQTELEFRLVVRFAILNLQANNASMMACHPGATLSQAIRLQANALALSKAADAAEARFQQLQSARAKRPQHQEPAPEAPRAQSSQAQAPATHTTKEEARLIKEFARKTGLSYPEAWTMYQQEKKAQAQAHTG